ncbi:energy transducer TonB [Sphingobacterium rhinopitheci]|uniref:energy transducer TonB n=1 Tax=Sphingobacterium rhinopitheci TaxID=2781960 RepID=UPI001F522F59|nr:energy transducer TonB [Sphingobacterium rhinopitheci]MCI0920583.1 energy transducer TonB [Sphingobacterium rhinopitheci]
MKYAITILLFIYTLTLANAQSHNISRKYYKKDNKETKDSTQAYYYRELRNNTTLIDPVLVLEKYSLNNKTKLLGTYNNSIEKKFVGQKLQGYENGKIKAQEKYSFDGVKIDTALYYHPNGKLKIAYEYLHTIENEKTIVTDTLILLFKDSLGNNHLVNGEGYAELYIEDNSANIKPTEIEKGHFKNHKRTGEWTGTFLGGKYTFAEQYNGGQLLSGISTDSLHNKTSYDQTTFMVQPSYPKGIQEFRRYIAHNYQYPKEAIQAKIKGQVRLSFVVEKDGSLSHIKVENDLGYGTGTEGVNVIGRSKKWIPGLKRGIPVRVSYVMPINLDLSN